MSVALPAALSIDRETRAAGHDHDALRLWLRLFTCNLMVERTIRARLRTRFGITLARFDYLAQLERVPQGLRMQELSRRLMVTGGNVTGLTRQLADEGLVERRAVDADRRAQVVRLTAKGRRMFAAMAAEHERWVVELFAGLPAADRARLHALLGHLKQSLGAHGHVAPVSPTVPVVRAGSAPAGIRAAAAAPATRAAPAVPATRAAPAAPVPKGRP